jgi:hypothetical protein
MSDWKEGALKRRDARQTKASDEHKTTSLKKRNTKKWCKGRFNIEHKVECQLYNEAKKLSYKHYRSWRLLVCTVCGKELEAYYGNKKHKPDWVDK